MAATEQHLAAAVRYPPGPANMPHRNNAAEWVIAAVVLPIRWLARGAYRTWTKANGQRRR